MGDRMQFVLDIETTGLLDNNLDYSVMPFKLLPQFKVHCVVLRHVNSMQVKSLYGEELTKDNLKYFLRNCTELVGHNIVNYDLPVLQLAGLMDYEICYPGSDSTGKIYGKQIEITDTLIWSKLLNADRFGGHSLDAWGKRLGNHKGDFHKWDEFSEEMLEYCIQDTAVNVDILKALNTEKGKHNWNKPYSMEVKLVDLTLNQQFFGFDFNVELAHKNLAELSEKMQVIAAKVNPILPLKKLPAAQINEYTAPKLKYKKDGTMSKHFRNFIEKHNIKLDLLKGTMFFEDKEFPMEATEPLKTEVPATVEDIDVVKGYLLNLGWVPSEIKERDLTKNQNKTTKTVVELKEAIERYVKQTSTSVFKDLRCEFLECEFEDLHDVLLDKIEMNKDRKPKPIYVPTTPKLAVGLEKEICPNLIKLGDKAEFVQDVVHYFTYRHRKNSIAGGVLDDDGEPETGFLSAVRSDGRVPTPADTLGANTGRYRHKIVCNIPRVTSLFGEPMRNQFGPGKGLWQLGYDFASLEARIMGHYVMQYENGPELADSLLASKPNDIHSLNAKKLGIGRNEAKSFSYAAIYGAQPKKLAKMLGISLNEAKRLFNEYWDAVIALKQLKEKVEQVWERSGKTSIPGIDGRLLSTRSKHSLINVLFQSGGAISAKWSAVRLAQALEKRNLLGDPFKHTTNDKKVWWMIHMHDEQQMACHPDLLQVKSFSSDDEAKAALQDGCSAIGHGSKGPYLGYKTVPIECIQEGIESACKELELRVPLGFEWIPGMSWGQCH